MASGLPAASAWPAGAGAAPGEARGLVVRGAAVLRSVEPRSVFLGRQEVALRNVTLAVFDAADAALLCAFDSGDGVARARLSARYADKVVLLAGTRWRAVWSAWQSCPSEPWESFVCHRISSVVVNVYAGSRLALVQTASSYHGWFALNHNNDWRVGDATGCDNFEGIETDEWQAFAADVAAATPPVELQGVDVLTEANHYEAAVRAPGVQMLLRHGAALATLAVALLAVRQWRLAARDGAKPVLQLALLWNAVTMATLCSWSAIDGYGTTGNFAVPMRNFAVQVLFGQGCALNLLICHMWTPALSDELRPHSRAARKAARSRSRRCALLALPRSRLAAAAYAASVADLTSATLMSQQVGGWLFYAWLIPGLLLATELATSYYLLRQAWRLHLKLQADLASIAGLNSPAHLKEGSREEREYQLERRLVRAGTLVAFSSCTSCAAIACAGVGLVFVSPSWYVGIAAATIYSRALTGFAQVHFCSRPTRRAAVHPTSSNPLSKNKSGAPVGEAPAASAGAGAGVGVGSGVGGSVGAASVLVPGLPGLSQSRAA